MSRSQHSSQSIMPIKNDKTRSIYKKGKDPEHADRYRISMDGNYFFNLDLPWYRKIWLLIDGLVTGAVYVVLGLIFSWILNTYVFLPLDKKLQKGVVFFQIVGESILNVLVLYVLVQLIPRFFPNIYPNPPGEHDYFKLYIGGILLSFGLLAAEYKLAGKVSFVFGTTDSIDDIVANFRRCNKDFRCGP